MANACYNTFVKTHKIYNTKSNVNINNGLWVLIICHHRFINCNKCILMGDVNGGGDCKVLGKGAIWEFSVLLAHFYYEHKTTLKNKIY